MISSISNSAHTQAVAPAPKAAPQKTSQPASRASGTDSVQLSQAAQAHLAAIQEAKETPAQTAKEARGGDRQAQRLLKKEQTTSSVSK
jgi:hypothetical protein